MAIVLIVAATLSAPGTSFAEEVVNKRLDAAKKGKVSIENVTGSVTVTGWARAEVAVEGSLGEDVEELRFERDGDKVNIEVINKSGHDVEPSFLKIHVPEGSSLEIDTVSADVDVTKVQGAIEVDTTSGEIDVIAKKDSGPVDLESVSGCVTVTSDAKAIEAESVSGDVKVTAGDAELELNSVSGDVEVQMKAGSIDAESVSGDLEIVCGMMTEVDLETVSGDIEFEGSLASKGRLEAESHSGEVTVVLPKSTDADFELSTFSGDIDSALGSGQFTPHGRGGEYTFRIGKGGGSVELSSFSGDIEIKVK